MKNIEQSWSKKKKENSKGRIRRSKSDQKLTLCVRLYYVTLASGCNTQRGGEKSVRERERV